MERTEEYSLPCTCGEGVEYAAIKLARTVEREESWHLLGPDHWPDIHGQWREERDIDERDGESEIEQSEEELLEVQCERCLRRARPEYWQLDPSETQTFEDDEPWNEVRCDNCDHEVEFGYSHPYPKGGRIWPCEALDFNPWLTWPDPRFVENWRRRGWLRPASPYRR
jgi:hypothetical protein